MLDTGSTTQIALAHRWQVRWKLAVSTMLWSSSSLHIKGNIRRTLADMKLRSWSSFRRLAFPDYLHQDRGQGFWVVHTQVHRIIMEYMNQGSLERRFDKEGFSKSIAESELWKAFQCFVRAASVFDSGTENGRPWPADVPEPFIAQGRRPNRYEFRTDQYREQEIYSTCKDGKCIAHWDIRKITSSSPKPMDRNSRSRWLSQVYHRRPGHCGMAQA